VFYIRKVGPNEALIISGGAKQPRVVVGSSTWISPFFQRADVLSLEVMTLTVGTPNVYTQEGVELSVDGVAQVKVARTEEAIRTAAQQFLGKKTAEIMQIALQTLEGHQRAMMATMTVEEIYKDRDQFAKQVREVASVDMARMGMEIVSFTIRNISDENGYLDALGIRRTSQVKRDAAIGQAVAEKEASVEQAEARRQSEAARLKSEQQVAESQRDFELAQAAYQKEINGAKAMADAALELEQARQRQAIRQEEMKVSLIERQRQIEIQEEEVRVKERELEASVRKPAEAERFRLETEAQGRKSQVIAEAEARAQATRLQGEAEANAEATEIRLRGEAEADAIRAKGVAEATGEVYAMPSSPTTVQPFPDTDPPLVHDGTPSDAPEEPLLSITLPVWSRSPELAEMARATIERIWEVARIPTEVVAIDNGSPYEIPLPAKVYRYPENKGVSTGWNTGIRLASADTVVVLNSDCRVEPGWDEALYEAVKDGRRVAFPYTDHCDGKGFAQPDQGGTAGWCFMMTKAIYDEVGVFDEWFNPAFCEDTDYWHRAWQMDIELSPVPAARVTHARRTTASTHPHVDWLLLGHRYKYGWKHGVDPLGAPPYYKREIVEYHGSFPSEGGR